MIKRIIHKFKSGEAGRSMVEMLAVLAIIGVLTIGAMAGYRYSLEVIMANNIVNGVTARSVIIGQQRVLGRPLNLKEFHPNSSKDLIYDRFEVEVYEDYYEDGTNIQALEVRDIPQNVCKRVVKTEFPDMATVAVNDVVDGECDIPDGDKICSSFTCSEEFLSREYHNTVAFIFGEGGYTGFCEKRTDCPYPICQKCQEGVCVANTDQDGEPCSTAAGLCCMDGVCISDESCGYEPSDGEESCGEVKHGEQYNDCGLCDNGTVIMGEEITDPCVQCDLHTDYKKTPRADGTGQSDGKCCVGGELKYDATHCPATCEGMGTACQVCDGNTGNWIFKDNTKTKVCGTECCGSEGCNSLGTGCKKSCEGTGNACQTCDDTTGEWVLNDSGKTNVCGTECCGSEGCNSLGTGCKKSCEGTGNACQVCDGNTGNWVLKDNTKTKVCGTECCGSEGCNSLGTGCKKACTGTGNICQVCDDTTGEWKTVEDGSNKQDDGRCCIDGALAYDAELCPAKDCIFDGITYYHGESIRACGICVDGEIQEDTSKTSVCKCDKTTWRADHSMTDPAIRREDGSCCVAGYFQQHYVICKTCTVDGKTYLHNEDIPPCKYCFGGRVYKYDSRRPDGTCCVDGEVVLDPVEMTYWPQCMACTFNGYGYENGASIGTCGKCVDGEIQEDTSKVSMCQTCDTSTWTLTNVANGSKPQSDGRCCVDGELKYDEACPPVGGDGEEDKCPESATFVGGTCCVGHRYWSDTYDKWIESSGVDAVCRCVGEVGNVIYDREAEFCFKCFSTEYSGAGTCPVGKYMIDYDECIAEDKIGLVRECCAVVGGEFCEPAGICLLKDHVCCENGSVALKSVGCPLL